MVSTWTDIKEGTGHSWTHDVWNRKVRWKNKDHQSKRMPQWQRMQDNKRFIQEGQQDTLGGLYLPVVWPLGYYKRSDWGIRTHIFILNNPKFCLTFACSITSILNVLQCLFCLYICDLQFWFLQKFCSSLHFFLQLPDKHQDEGIMWGRLCVWLQPSMTVTFPSTL